MSHYCPTYLKQLNLYYEYNPPEELNSEVTSFNKLYLRTVVKPGHLLFIGHSWVRDLEKNILPSDLPITFDFVEYKGYPGATFETLSSKIDAYPIESCPQCIVVLAGSNDLSLDISDLKSNALKFYTKLRKRFPNSFIIASNIENRFYSDSERHKLSPPIEEYRRKARSFKNWIHKKNLPVNKTLYLNDPKISCINNFKADGVHLNRRGLLLLDTLISTLLIKLFP